MRLWQILPFCIPALAQSTLHNTSAGSVNTVRFPEPAPSIFHNISSSDPTPIRPTPIDPTSIAALLATAVPHSVIQAIATNSPAAISSIYSQFAAGATPAWFAALPSDVQTYLVPVTTIPRGSVAVLSAMATATGDGSEGVATRTASHTPSQTVGYVPVTSTIPNNGPTMGGATIMRNSTVSRTVHTGTAMGLLQNTGTTQSMSISATSSSPTVSDSTTTSTTAATTEMSSDSATADMTVTLSQTTAPGNAGSSLLFARFGIWVVGIFGVLLL